jgi:hypothetical protein
VIGTFSARRFFDLGSRVVTGLVTVGSVPAVTEFDSAAALPAGLVAVTAQLSLLPASAWVIVWVGALAAAIGLPSSCQT